MDNVISKKTIHIGAIAFWIFVYIIAVVISFPKINFGSVGPKDSIFTIFPRPFLFSFWSYSPLYILSLILLGYSVRQKRIIKILPALLAIVLSIILCLISFFSSVLGETHESNVLMELVLPIFIIHIFFSFIFIAILYYQGTEKLIRQLVLFSLFLLIILLCYIGFFSYYAFQAGPILKELSQQAIKARDVSLCDRILEESKKRHVSEFRIGSVVGDNYIECVQKIAVETNIVELCKKIDIGFEDCKCIGMIGAATNNPNLCYQEVTIKKQQYVGTHGTDFYTEACLEAYNSFIKNKTGEKVEAATTDWKTYRNEEYGFEIKYPETNGISFFKIIVDSEREFLFGTIVCMEGEEATVLGKIRLSPNIEVAASSFEELGRQPTEEECDTLANGYVVSGRFCTNKNLTQYQDYCEEGSETSDYHRYDIFLACDGENFKGKEGRIKCNQFFNQILSTFKFIEEGETADWKTYKNDKYGFEFKYPTNISINYEGKTEYVLQPFKVDFNSFLVTVWDNSKKLDIKDYFLDNSACTQNKPICEYLDQGYSFETIKVGEADGFTTSIGVGSQVLVSTTEKKYIIEFLNRWPDDIEKTKVFNQILSSFRFSE